MKLPGSNQKTFGLLLSLLVLAAITGCSTCQPQSPGMESTALKQEHSDSWFWECFGDAVAQLFLSGVIPR